jgi:hypothetical protein
MSGPWLGCCPGTEASNCMCQNGCTCSCATCWCPNARNLLAQQTAEFVGLTDIPTEYTGGSKTRRDDYPDRHRLMSAGGTVLVMAAADDGEGLADHRCAGR